jgi:cell division protein FtsB
MPFGSNTLWREEQSYKVLLFLACLLLFTVSTFGTISVYRSYLQCKAMEERERYQLNLYRQMRDELEMRQEQEKELEENPDFLRHVARERIQFMEDSELLFRFE